MFNKYNAKELKDFTTADTTKMYPDFIFPDCRQFAYQGKD